MALAPAFEWTLGDRLRKTRMAAGLDQAQIALQVGVSRPTVSKWERNLTEPSATQALRWAQVTSTTVGDLLGEMTSARKVHNPRQLHLDLAWSQPQIDRRFAASERPPLLMVVPDLPTQSDD